MNESRRVLRVERELLEVLSRHLHTGLKEPLPGMISVLHVQVSADLKQAKVYIRATVNPADLEAVERSLQKQRADIQRHVAKELKLRFNPVLRFLVRPSSEEFSEVDAMLARLHGQSPGEDFDQ